MPDIVMPSNTGPAALDDLEKAPWAHLAHAYGTGPADNGDPHADVAGTLRRLAIVAPDYEPIATTTDDGAGPPAFDDAIFLLHSNISTQGTIYQATAYAVPFLAAFAAGDDVTPSQRRSLMALLAEIGIASAFDEQGGWHAGSSGGPEIGADTRAAIVQSARWLNTVAADPEFSPVVSALLGLETDPDKAATELSVLVDV